MTPIIEIMTRIIVTLAVEAGTHPALMCAEVAEGLKEIYPDGQVSAAEIILVEELFLIRIMSYRMEQLLGHTGMFIRRGARGETTLPHPAMAQTLRNRDRFKKTWNGLAWRHGVAGLQPSREKALAKAANAGATPSNGTQSKAQPAAPSIATQDKAGNGAATSRTPLASPAKPAGETPAPLSSGPL